MSASTDITTHAGVRGMRIDWTPYVMGAGIGVLSWIVFVFADDPLGVTTALSAVAGFAAMPFTGADAVWHNSYWAQTVPSVSYGSMFLVGVVLGAFAASVAARQFHVETVPAVWRQRFGNSSLWRRLRRRRAGNVWRAARRRLRQRSWHQRHSAIGAVELGVHDPDVRDSHPRRLASFRQRRSPAMTLPVTGPALLPLGTVFGFAFGWLLQRARIADTNVIIAQLRLRDYTLFKVMLTGNYP